MISVSHHSHIEVSMAVADGLAHVCNNHGEVARSLYIRSIQRNDHNLGGFPFGSNCRSPRWEVEGSKGNSAIRGNCGNIAERRQVGNNRWKVGNNRMWRHRDLAYFSQFHNWVNITQMYLTCWFWFNYWSSWENNMSTFIFNQFSLYSYFMQLSQRSTIRKIFSVPRTSPSHMICFPHLHLLKIVRSVRASPVCSICLRGPPTRGEVKWNRLFWIGGGGWGEGGGAASVSMLRLWKTALMCLRLFNGPVVTISSGVLYINTQKYLGPVEQTMCVPRIQLPSYYAITETFER